MGYNRCNHGFKEIEMTVWLVWEASYEPALLGIYTEKSKALEHAEKVDALDPNEWKCTVEEVPLNKPIYG